MRTNEDFNSKYIKYLREGQNGMSVEVPAVIQFVDSVFSDLILIPGFEYSDISLRFGMCWINTNLHEVLPVVGDSIIDSIEEKANFLIKVENEITKRINNTTVNHFEPVTPV
jgi:hypothetical protein